MKSAIASVAQSREEFKQLGRLRINPESNLRGEGG
jgi:hypothetical protein